jgi:hypothetical protein
MTRVEDRESDLPGLDETLEDVEDSGVHESGQAERGEDDETPRFTCRRPKPEEVSHLATEVTASHPVEVGFAGWTGLASSETGGGRCACKAMHR